jgi:hypothetical protein
MFLRWLASCRPHRRGRLQTKVGHVGPLPRRRRNAVQDKVLPQGLQPAEQHGLHWLAHLAIFRVGDVSPLARVLPPPLPRLAATKVGPLGPLAPQAAQNDARQVVAAMTPVSEKHGLHFVGQLGQLQCRRISPKSANPISEKSDYTWPSPLPQTPRLPSTVYFPLINLVLSAASSAVLGAQRPRTDCPAGPAILTCLAANPSDGFRRNSAEFRKQSAGHPPPISLLNKRTKAGATQTVLERRCCAGQAALRNIDRLSGVPLTQIL